MYSTFSVVYMFLIINTYIYICSGTKQCLEGNNHSLLFTDLQAHDVHCIFSLAGLKYKNRSTTTLYHSWHHQFS